MGSKLSIQMDYQKALKQAQELEIQAGKLEHIANRKMDDYLQMTSIHWKSESATQYVRKGKTLQNKIKNSAKELKNIAGSVRKIAKGVYDAEMKAKEIAEMRTYR